VAGKKSRNKAGSKAPPSSLRTIGDALSANNISWYVPVNIPAIGDLFDMFQFGQQ
jgi:hypothetical protein